MQSRKGYGIIPSVAGVAEWQTRRIQNPLPLKACGFKSHLRHIFLKPYRFQVFICRTVPDLRFQSLNGFIRQHEMIRRRQISAMHIIRLRFMENRNQKTKEPSM